MAIGRLRLKNFSYDFPPWRPPSESQSLLVRVTRGCTWNRCTFCSMYRHMTFERRSLEDIHRDIDSAAGLYSGQVSTIFIGDSNSPSIPAADFVDILARLKEAFPAVQRITSYARAKTLLKKPLDDLKMLRSAGLSRLHVGLESGDPDILKKIRKGATPQDMVGGCAQAKEAGFELSLYVLLGLGGEQLWERHARNTARILSAIDPHFIRVRTLQPQPGSELYEALQNGAFVKAAPLTVLREQLLLIRELHAASRYLSDHITNYVTVEGTLPEGKPAMIETLESAIANFEHDSGLQARCSRKDSITRL
jgi:radical SAM superfamily enzyme YgiQ (UPF0313 family)